MIDVVAAYITQDNKVLITQRAHGALAGKWEFPGGKVEKNEDLFAAIKREISEELNLIVEPKKIIKSFIHLYDFGEIHLTLIECLLTGNRDIISDGSHTNYQWTDITDTTLSFAPLDKKIVTFLSKTYK